MPTATDELRAQIVSLFGDIDLHAPLQYLKAKGFKELAGVLIPPLPDYALSEVEGDCIDFLCDEWDFAYDPTLALALQEKRGAVE